MHIEQVIKQAKFKNEYQKAAINMMHTMNTLSSQKQLIFDRYDISEHQFNVMRILRGALPETLGINEIRNRMVDKNSVPPPVSVRVAIFVGGPLAIRGILPAEIDHCTVVELVPIPYAPDAMRAIVIVIPSRPCR